MVSKYGHSMPPGACPDKVTPNIDFTDEAVVQCDVKIVQFKNTFVKINFDVNTCGGLMCCL